MFQRLSIEGYQNRLWTIQLARVVKRLADQHDHALILVMRPKRCWLGKVMIPFGARPLKRVIQRKIAGCAYAANCSPEKSRKATRSRLTWTRNAKDSISLCEVTFTARLGQVNSLAFQNGTYSPHPPGDLAPEFLAAPAAVPDSGGCRLENLVPLRRGTATGSSEQRLLRLRRRHNRRTGGGSGANCSGGGGGEEGADDTGRRRCLEPRRVL